MRGGEAFEEVLDQHIQGLEADRRVTFTASSCSTATAYGFFFPPTQLRCSGETSPPTQLRCDGAMSSDPLRSLGEAGSGLLRGSDEVDRRTFEPSFPGTFAPPSSRALSGVERAALLELVALGARLHESFTLRELRSAFRALARRYHPDRHADSSGDEKASLAMIFSRVCDCYQVLARI